MLSGQIQKLSSAGGLQGSEIIAHELPQHRRRDALILVPENVADCGDFLPGNARVARLKVSG
jgi:hypothetical protein